MSLLLHIDIQEKVCKIPVICPKFLGFLDFSVGEFPESGGNKQEIQTTNPDFWKSWEFWESYWNFANCNPIQENTGAEDYTTKWNVMIQILDSGY
jgi:hypothetical protein